MTKNYTLAMAGEPRCTAPSQPVWYMTVLEAIRNESVEAVSTYPDLVLDSLEMIFWRYSTNCIRVGQVRNTYVITLNSEPTFEVHFEADENLNLLSAHAESEALSEALPQHIDVTKYVVILYQGFLVGLVSQLNETLKAHS